MSRMQVGSMLKQIGVITLPARSRCAVCNGGGVELAVREGDSIATYHWHCVERIGGVAQLSLFSISQPRQPVACNRSAGA